MAAIARRPAAPVTFLVPGTESAGVSLTRGITANALAAAGRGRIKHSVSLSSQRAASGAAVPVTAVPGEDVVVLHIDGGPSLVLHPENARDLLRSQEGGVEATRGGGGRQRVPSPSGCSGAGSRRRRQAPGSRAGSSAVSS